MQIKLTNPKTFIRKVNDAYILTFEEDSNVFEVELTDINMKAFGLTAIATCPILNPEIVLDSELDAVRYLAKPLFELDDRSIQLLLREVQSDTLIYFMWFIKDEELIQTIFRNMSQRAGEMLADDLLEISTRYGNPDSERVKKTVLRDAMDSTKYIVSVYNRLSDEGQI